MAITRTEDHLNKSSHGPAPSVPRSSKSGFGDEPFALIRVVGWQLDIQRHAAGQWQWSDGNWVCGDFSIQQTWPFLAGPVPMFAKVSSISRASRRTIAPSQSDNLNGEFNLSPSLRGFAVWGE